MILFGQSAGGASVDFYSYAYTKDPIIHGLIPQSGTAAITARTTANSANTTAAAFANWSKFSDKMGCGTVPANDITKSLPCMRSKSAAAVLDACAPVGGASSLGTWGPKFDSETVMPDTVDRGAKGNFIKVVSSSISHTQGTYLTRFG
jgi:cholinesterase